MILKFEKFVKSVEILQKYVFIHLVLCQFCPASDPTVLSISKGLGWAGMFFYIYLLLPLWAHRSTVWRGIISNKSGTYYLEYSSFVLALFAQLLSILTWLLDWFRSGDPRSSARSPLSPLVVGVGFWDQNQVSASSFSVGSLTVEAL